MKRGRFVVTGAGPGGAEATLGEFGPRDWTGEMAVLTGQTRSATVAALEDGELIRLSREGFDELTGRFPAVAARLSHEIGPRLRLGQLLRVWEELFGLRDPEAFLELEAVVEWRRVPAGEVLLRQGEPSDALYVVVTRRLRTAVRGPDGSETVVRETGTFRTVGELGLLAELPRSVTVMALRDTEVLRLPREAFRTFALPHPEALLRVAAIVAQRQANPNPRPSRAEASGLTYAVLPITPSETTAGFARPLAERLSARPSSSTPRLSTRGTAVREPRRRRCRAPSASRPTSPSASRPRPTASPLPGRRSEAPPLARARSTRLRERRCSVGSADGERAEDRRRR